MAELGQAELVLTANTQQLEKALAKVRDDLSSLETRPLKLRIDTSGAQGLSNVQGQLRNVSTETDRAAEKTRTLAQLINGFAGGSYSKLSAQIRQLTSESIKLQLVSDDYLETLTRIKELEGLRAIRSGRQAVRADAAAYSPKGALSQLDPEQLPSLPNTIAADQQLITELTQRLQNLDRNSGAYGQTLVELKQAQERVRDALRGTTASYRELEQAEERSIRRAEKLRGLQAYYADKNPRAGGVRDENGAIRARGSNSARDEAEYNKAIRPATSLLELDLQRVRALREAVDRLREQRTLLEGLGPTEGFGASSSRNFRGGTTDPVEKSVRRNQEKVAAEAEREGRAREQALRVTQQQLQADLKREQTLRQIAERIKQSAADSTSGFGAASASNFGTSDPTQKSIRRNAEKVAAQEERAAAQRAALEEDLAQQISKRTQSQERIIAEQQQAIAAAKKEVAAAKASANAKQAAAKAEREATAQRRKENRKRLGEAAGNALIGGAFPALFGQGLGASAGGAIGGGLGGLLGGNFGFGLSLLGTALGQRFDDINKALENPIANFEQLKTTGALSSKSLEKYAEGLIETGRTAEAAAVIQRDLAASFGADSLNAFAEVRGASDELNRSFAQAAAAVATFVAGPFAAFLRQLADAGNNFATATRFENLVGRLNPDQYRQVRDVTDRATRDAQRRRGGVPFLPPSEGDVAEGRKAGIEEAKRLLGLKEEELALERAIAQARLQTAKELSNNFRLISAQVQGNRTAQLDERANAVIDERNRRLRELAAQNITAQNDPRVVEANQTAAKELFRIEEERLQLQKEIAKTVAQESIKRDQIAKSIGAATARRDAALAAADSAANPGNSTLAARAGQLEGASFLEQNRLRIEQAVTRERELQAQLAQESDPTRRSQLAEQLRTAADELRLAGEEAGAALAERAASAAQSLRSAQDALRGTLESNFKYLPRAQRQSLLDSAREDIARGKATGILRPDFGAAGRRRTLDAARAVRDIENQRAQVAQQQALVEALKENTNAERNIRINITMNADGTATANQTDAQAALL